MLFHITDMLFLFDFIILSICSIECACVFIIISLKLIGTCLFSYSEGLLVILFH